MVSVVSVKCSGVRFDNKSSKRGNGQGCQHVKIYWTTIVTVFPCGYFSGCYWLVLTQINL